MWPQGRQATLRAALPKALSILRRFHRGENCMPMHESPVDAAWLSHPPLGLDEAGACLDLLDQTLLPFAVERRRVTSVAQCVEAIRAMRVRGAPLIGLAAAGGMALAANADPADAALEAAAAALLDSRPTAVNLRWAVEDMLVVLRALPPAARGEGAWARARALERSEHACCERIGIHGLELLRRAAQSPAARRRGHVAVLTHCNAGWLATGAWGTALAPVYRAQREGIPVHVWVDETRPRNQGARLTAWELGAAGVPHTLIADNAAGHLMQRGAVDLCLVGSDRTTARGDVCNKIGTYQKALAAADNRVPFHVALPVSTIDWNLRDGLAEIPIEERAAAEVLAIEGIDAHGRLHAVRAAAAATPACNPAFDVTPARLVTSLVCEHGVFRADAAGMEALLAVATPPPGRV
jgi:methylthioribose-1-phosphate isomerase